MRSMRGGVVVKAVLGVIAVAGLLVVAAVAGNAIQLLDTARRSQYPSRRRNYINQTIEKLKKCGLITIQPNHQGVPCARLTECGQQELEKYRLREKGIEVPKKWDGKYRLIIFDIKEWKRSKRDSLRRWLEHLGLVRLQNSVWVCPYECREVVALLKSQFRLGREVLYLVADSIEGDYWLKKRFNLV